MSITFSDVAPVARVSESTVLLQNSPTAGTPTIVDTGFEIVAGATA